MGRGASPSVSDAAFVKNLSKYVQESFTNATNLCGILTLSKGKTPSFRRTPFTPCFLSFTFSFYPLFHFAWLAPCFPAGKQGASLSAAPVCKCYKSFTGYSKSVHTLRAAPGYTEYVSKGSRNPAAGKPTDLLFLFYPPFFKSV